jgi:hypothetical protein
LSAEVKACLQIAFGNQTISTKIAAFAAFFTRDSRLCVPASRQVCPYRVQPSCKEQRRRQVPTTLVLNMVQNHLSILSILPRKRRRELRGAKLFHLFLTIGGAWHKTCG